MKKAQTHQIPLSYTANQLIDLSKPHRKRYYQKRSLKDPNVMQTYQVYQLIEPEYDNYELQRQKWWKNQEQKKQKQQKKATKKIKKEVKQIQTKLLRKQSQAISISSMSHSLIEINSTTKSQSESVSSSTRKKRHIQPQINLRTSSKLNKQKQKQKQKQKDRQKQIQTQKYKHKEKNAAQMQIQRLRKKKKFQSQKQARIKQLTKQLQYLKNEQKSGLKKLKKAIKYQQDQQGQDRQTITCKSFIPHHKQYKTNKQHKQKIEQSSIKNKLQSTKQTSKSLNYCKIKKHQQKSTKQKKPSTTQLNNSKSKSKSIPKLPSIKLQKSTLTKSVKKQSIPYKQCFEQKSYKVKKQICTDKNKQKQIQNQQALQLLQNIMQSTINIQKENLKQQQQDRQNHRINKQLLRQALMMEPVFSTDSEQQTQNEKFQINKIVQYKQLASIQQQTQQQILNVNQQPQPSNSHQKLVKLNQQPIKIRKQQPGETLNQQPIQIINQMAIKQLEQSFIQSQKQDDYIIIDCEQSGSEQGQLIIDNRQTERMVKWQYSSDDDNLQSNNQTNNLDVLKLNAKQLQKLKSYQKQAKQLQLQLFCLQLSTPSQPSQINHSLINIITLTRPQQFQFKSSYIVAEQKQKQQVKCKKLSCSELYKKGLDDYFMEILPLIDLQNSNQQKSFTYMELPKFHHQKGLRYDPDQDIYSY